MYVNSILTSELLYWIRNVLLKDFPQFKDRVTYLDIRRYLNGFHLDCEFIILLDGTQLIDLSSGNDTYYEVHAQGIIDQIHAKLNEIVLLSDSGEPHRLTTHKYNIEPAVMLNTTHLYDILELIMQTVTHKYNVEDA
jgi:hypothetical protein